MDVTCECCLLSDTGLYVLLITRPENPYWLWCAWVSSWNLDNVEAFGPLAAVAPRKEEEKVYINALEIKCNVLNRNTTLQLPPTLN